MHAGHCVLREKNRLLLLCHASHRSLGTLTSRLALSVGKETVSPLLASCECRRLKVYRVLNGIKWNKTVMNNRKNKKLSLLGGQGTG